MRSSSWGPLALCLLFACAPVTDPGAQADDDAGPGTFPDASSDCTLECDEAATCVGADDEAMCVCRDGYRGDGLSCTDIDECAEGALSCSENTTCTNLPGSARCDCPHGSVGDGDGGCRSGLLFFAAATAADTPRYFKSLDTASGTVADEALMPADSDDFCDCEQRSDGPISAEGALYYFGQYAQRYDGAAWTSIAQPAHARRTQYGAAYLGGRIYLAGGRDVDGVARADLIAYTPATGAWTRMGELSSLPFPTTYPAIGVSDGLLWVFGEHANAGGTRLAYYDPATDEWTEETAPGLVGPRFHGLTGSGLFVIQGAGTILVYDTRSASVVAEVQLPDDTNVRIARVGDGIYSVGEDGGDVVIRAGDPGTIEPWTEIGRVPGVVLGANGYVGSSNLAESAR